MTLSIRHILTASALLLLGACTSGYVSGYEEMRGSTTAQPPAPSKQQSPKKQTAKKSEAKKQTAKKQAEKKQTAKAQPKTSKTSASREANTARKTTAALNQAQLNKTRAATSSSAPPKAQAQAQSVTGGTVTVGPGETLFAISRRPGVELRDIVVANDLEPPYALRSGQKLTIPAARYHIVRPSETGYSISRAYGTDLTTLARLNNLEKPYAVQVGQRLRLPASPTLTNGDKPRTNTASASRPSTAKAQTATQNTTTASASPRPAAKAPSAPAVVARTFSWPLTGRILSRFGPKQGGLHNDGVNIAATQGATVRAAAPGVVAYASDGLKGFGWLILIKHDDNWVTAYAHNEALLVKRGDTVRAGEPIARAGRSGSVDRPQLHFEIRNGRRAVDPLKHLPPNPVS